MSSKTKRIGTLADIYRSQHLDGTITRLRLDHIQPSEEQPRKDRTAGIEDLAKSLQVDGLLSPIIVRKEQNHYRIIAGERRYHAACKLNWEQIECRIISRQEQDYWRIAIVENLQRENLNSEEEAIALLRLKKQENLSDSDLSKLVGKSRNYIVEILGIAQLPQEVLIQCKTHGIEQKNMLIQVVQSYRKGKFYEFLSQYQKGNIKNIREARYFNHDTPQEKKSTGSQDKQSSSKKFTIRAEKNKITIWCSDEEQAKKLAAKLNSKIHTL